MLDLAKSRVTKLKRGKNVERNDVFKRARIQLFQ